MLMLYIKKLEADNIIFTFLHCFQMPLYIGIIEVWG